MKKDSKYKKVYIVRSVVPTRDMGFLPGNSKEKTKVYEGPYYEICTKLFGRGDAYDYLKNAGKIEFVTTSFLRGITLDECIVVVDESQSMTFHELDTVITRLGDNAKTVFCGDINQNDLKYRKNDVSGLWDFMSILKKMKMFNFIEFHEDDIVRGSTVKAYIITKNKLGM
jgi:phosphate starvation-inducible protein PhoH